MLKKLKMIVIEIFGLALGYMTGALVCLPLGLLGVYYLSETTDLMWAAVLGIFVGYPVASKVWKKLGVE